MGQAIATLGILPQEAEFFTFDFSQREEIAAGRTIVNATVTEAMGDGLSTIGSPSIVSPQVQVQISTCTADTLYHFLCVATLDDGTTIACCGPLLCEDC